jgi:hypothetical protein
MQRMLWADSQDATAAHAAMKYGRREPSLTASPRVVSK